MTADFKRNQFDIMLPDGWEDQTVYTFRGPDDSGIQHNLVLIIDPDPGKLNLQEYAKMRLDSIKDTLPGFELMSEQEKQLKSGRQAYEIVYKWSPAEGKMLIQKQVYLIIGGRAYNFTASFSKKTIRTIGSQVDEIIGSFTPAGG
jgi:hypothetical protein